MEKQYTLIHDAENNRYAFDLGNGARAFIDYVPSPQGYLLTHTEVPPAFEGQGIARQLVEATLGEFRRRGERIIPQCSYIIHFIRRNPEWASLLPGGDVLKKP